MAKNYVKIDSDNIEVTETYVSNITRAEINANITLVQQEIAELQQRLSKFQQALALLDS